MTRLILWRHGQSMWNATKRIQGHADIDMSPVGHEQAAATAARLAEFAPDRIVSSDLRRALDTAAPLAALTGLEVTVDARLRERFYGEWQGLTNQDLAQQWPVEYARWRAGEPVPGAGVEGVEDVGKRVAAAVEDAMATLRPGPSPDGQSGATIVVATHGGSIRYGCAAILGWSAQVVRSMGNVRNCHWAELIFDPERGWRLAAYNAGVEPVRER